MEDSKIEYKELLLLNKKLLILQNLVIDFRNNLKSVGCCLKLVKIESKNLKKSKIPVSVSEFNSINWKYKDLTEILKVLKKAKKVETINKALNDLESLKRKTENDIAVLKEKINPLNGTNIFSATLENTAQAISKSIEKGAQKLSDTLGSAVNGKVEGLKKRLIGED